MFQARRGKTRIESHKGGGMVSPCLESFPHRFAVDTDVVIHHEDGFHGRRECRR
jgi:hypothetical protein